MQSAILSPLPTADLEATETSSKPQLNSSIRKKYISVYLQTIPKIAATFWTSQRATDLARTALYTKIGHATGVTLFKERTKDRNASTKNLGGNPGGRKACSGPRPAGHRNSYDHPYREPGSTVVRRTELVHQPL